MKISIVGAGLAGCFTALNIAFRYRNQDVEVELIYNPEIPPERVGQATLFKPPALLWASIGFDWTDNPIHATPKTGVLYEGWGKVNDKISHPFTGSSIGMHYCPWEVQKYILNSGVFNVIEKDVDPKDVDSDYVFDCRGKPKDFSNYEEIINPINSALLSKPKWNTKECLWSRHVATPDGWTFVIPNYEESPSYNYSVGYLYNSDISSREDVKTNLLDIFDVDISDAKYISFDSYFAKEPIVDSRIFLNGNKLFFIEPLESSATETYLYWSNICCDIINGNKTEEDGKGLIRTYIKEIENFVLWHYQFGSKYDTPFWDYAKTLKIPYDSKFNKMLDLCKGSTWDAVIPSDFGGDYSSDVHYAYWTPLSIKQWWNAMNYKIDKSSELFLY